MSCNCNNLPTPSKYPSIVKTVASENPCGCHKTIETKNTACSDIDTGACCEDFEPSVNSSGVSIPQLVDATPVTDMVLLGRVGKNLAKFEGTGFIQIIDGSAFLVSSLPMVVSTLFHETSNNIIGEPLPYPFKVITDLQGVTHAIRGLQTVDSIEVWNSTTKQFEQRAVGDFPIQTSECLPKSEMIEMIGFEKQTNCNDVRKVKALSGQGIVVLAECPAPDCCDTEKQSYVHAIPYPEDEQSYYLRYSAVNGIYFEPASTLTDGKSAFQTWLDLGNSGTEQDFINSLKGIDGVNGDDGDDGLSGKSAYDIWLGLGFTGTQQDFLATLKGDTGATGATGDTGGSGAANLTVATETIYLPRIIFAPITPAQNINSDAAGAVVAGTPSRIDTGWTATGALGTFTVSESFNHTTIEVNVIASAGTEPADKGTSVVVELFKNTVLVASQVISPESENGVSEASANLTYTDSEPAASASYSIGYRREGDNTTSPLTVTAGYVSATAYIEQQVVTSVS